MLFVTMDEVRKFGVHNFCDTTATDNDDFVRKRHGLIACVRNITNLQTDTLFFFLIRYILREQERIKRNKYKKIKEEGNAAVKELLLLQFLNLADVRSTSVQ
jgi:hypothetical protein